VSGQAASPELQQQSFSAPPQPHPSDPPALHAPPPHLAPAMSRSASRGLRAGLLLRDNLVHRRSIERAYLKAIGSAKREVLIANAYFFPGRRFRRALIEAMRRGVPVRLLLQGRIEYTLPHLATQAMYPPLLAAGIEIVEYHRSFLHAKVAVIDDWATVGSSNIDPFSLLLAREANVVVFDAGFAAELRGQLRVAMAEGGKPIEREQLARRPRALGPAHQRRHEGEHARQHQREQRGHRPQRRLEAEHLQQTSTPKAKIPRRRRQLPQQLRA
jgi:cardiolipin synthase